MTAKKNTDPAEYQTAFELARQMFGARDDVTGIDIGYRRVGGQATEDLAVRLHVAQKRRAEDLAEQEMFPSHIEGIPVDVIESQHVVQRGPGRSTERHAILTGGMSVGRLNDGAGTISAIVIDNETDRPALLSNWHVLVGASGQFGDPILQPGELDGGEGLDAIATLGRSVLNQDGDAAIALLNGKRAWLPIQYGTKATIKAARMARLGERIVKQGRAMDTLEGRVDGEGIYRLPFETDPGVVEIREMRGFAIAPSKTPGDAAARSGDSGALWLSESDKAALGMHVAANKDATQIVACHLPSVLDALDVRLATYEDLFHEAERMEALAHDPRGSSYDRYYAPMDFGPGASVPDRTDLESAGRPFVAALEDPRDLPPMMPVETMPEGLYVGMPLELEDEYDMTASATWQRLTQTLQAEGYTLDANISPSLILRDLIETDYPEYVLAGIIETSRHFKDWFDPHPTGAFYRSCKTLGQVCNKLAALHEYP